MYRQMDECFRRGRDRYSRSEYGTKTKLKGTRLLKTSFNQRVEDIKGKSQIKDLVYIKKKKFVSLAVDNGTGCTQHQVS